MKDIFNDRPWWTRLKLYRIAAGLTQEQMAHVLGVHHRNYWGWEAGRNIPSKTTQGAIAKALGAEVPDIFGEDPQRKGRG